MVVAQGPGPSNRDPQLQSLLAGAPRLKGVIALHHFPNRILQEAFDKEILAFWRLRFGRQQSLTLPIGLI